MVEAALINSDQKKKAVSREEQVASRYQVHFRAVPGSVTGIRQWSNTHVYSRTSSLQEAHARSNNLSPPAPTVHSTTTTTQRITYKTSKGSTGTFDVGASVLVAEGDEIVVVWIKRQKKKNTGYVPAYVKNISSGQSWYLKTNTLFDDAGFNMHPFLLLIRVLFMMIASFLFLGLVI